MPKYFFLLALSFLLPFSGFADQDVPFSIRESDIVNGEFTQKIWIESYARPTITLDNEVLAFDDVQLPDGIVPSTANAFAIEIGRERKQPFVLVHIPAYRQLPGGNLQRLTFGVLHIKEAPFSQNNFSALKTTAANSPLSQGTWYKIAVPATGVYKLDNTFFAEKLGISGNIASNNIRIFGNGGAMLPEANAAPRQANLTENAILVNDGGDGNLNGADYVAFYAMGPTAWTREPNSETFRHRKNLYADSAYYFISLDNGAGLRTNNLPAVSGANTTVTSYNYYDAHEKDEENPGRFGKIWYGDVLTGSKLSTEISFALPEVVAPVQLRTIVAARSFSSSSVISTSYNNGVSIDNFSLNRVDNGDDKNPVSYAFSDRILNNVGNTLILKIDFTPGSGGFDAKGYLDFFEINTRAKLALIGSSLLFRDVTSVGTGNVANFVIANAPAGMQVMDITNPYEAAIVNGVSSGNNFSFTANAETLHEYAAFLPAALPTPYFISQIANQNLHGEPDADFLIVTPAAFLAAANQLADYHRTNDNMRVLVATTSQIYNEFSSGGQDVSAIRDFARYFYDRAGQDTANAPKNLLLFGDASYDYKNRTANNTNFVPVFESAQSVVWTQSFSSDDFYGFLDENEDMESFTAVNTLDLGIGRIPVQNLEDAITVVEKIKNYTSPASFGPWKLSNTFMADDADGAGNHLDDAESIASVVDAVNPSFVDSKIYMDNYPYVSTPGGIRCPQAAKSLSDNIFKGTFLVNYSGHGNPTSLAHERLLTIDDIRTWKNLDKLPFMVTSTCDFSRFDNPAYTSAGEMLITKKDGGSIAMLTTTHQVYASQNRLLNTYFLASMYQRRSNGQWNTFGEAYRAGKNIMYTGAGDKTNTRQFVLLGDPALQPAFPKEHVSTDSIVSLASNTSADTVNALGGYAIKGHISNSAGDVLEGFNGKVYVTFYDKSRKLNIKLKNYADSREVTMQDNIIYKGAASVTNGHFSVSFIAPKDLNYDFGHARITYYAENGVTDAAGADTNIMVGGFSDDPFVEDNAPVVKAYIDDSLFTNGGLTGSNTLLFATIADESGINVTGSSIGHDLTAILDGDEEHPFNMNDYYETVPNSYSYGIVKYPVTGLPDGKHILTIKAWDVNNNSGTGSVFFEIANGNVFLVSNLMNYPNPFSGVTHFVFQHNHPNELIKAQVAIYDMTGKLITILSAETTPGNSRSSEMTWDGRSDVGSPLPAGVYPYRLILTTEKGVQTTAYQKLVLIR